MEKELTDYIEMDDFDWGVSDEDKLVELTYLAKRYETLAKLCKEKAKQYIRDGVYTYRSSFYNDRAVKLKTRTTQTVNDEMLRLSYPDVYTDLASKGLLTAKAKDLKDYDVRGVIETTTSSYLQVE